MFERYKVDNLQGLIVNYLTAAGCSYFLFRARFLTRTHLLNSGWIISCNYYWTLFIIVFNFYAFGTQKVGVSVTTVANKMSLIIPICAALILISRMKKALPSLKGIAFFLALVGIYLSYY